MTTHRGIAVALALTAVVSTACAPLPSETTPRAINPDKIAELSPTTTSVADSSGREPRVVCFVTQRKDDNQQDVTAESQDDNSDLTCVGARLENRTARALINALAAGPDPEQRALGLTSSIPQDTTLLEPATVDGDTITINLSSAINDVSSPNNTLAYHQIVETLTHPLNELGVDRVQVYVDGKATKIPTDDGSKNVATVDDFHRATTTPSTRRSGVETN